MLNFCISHRKWDMEIEKTRGLRGLVQLHLFCQFYRTNCKHLSSYSLDPALEWFRETLQDFAKNNFGEHLNYEIQCRVGIPIDLFIFFGEHFSEIRGSQAVSILQRNPLHHSYLIAYWLLKINIHFKENWSP